MSILKDGGKKDVPPNVPNLFPDKKYGSFVAFVLFANTTLFFYVLWQMLYLLKYGSIVPTKTTDMDR